VGFLNWVFIWDEFGGYLQWDWGTVLLVTGWVLGSFVDGLIRRLIKMI
jgi:hypothetical protein